eukprot:CAMPEP_0176433458 /NCGR_PEP_ID=MMETSP0127-20121128/16033_1 /TAXON_ID=938130 /ORGANISM="Platyophrya macrostoma, Strain WH" /LENGTH=211 /DNA_ID=CAMNT_0017815887 /DNA_START=344 /DNA_END=980 /DNA_ORIENTATION=-
MHVKGECDMRGTYIAMVVADILNILTDELKDGVGDAIAACQTYEGGICTGSPMEEAHGGLTYCGFAALCCIREEKKIDLNRLLYWAVQRQMKDEGGFNGRTTKLWIPAMRSGNVQLSSFYNQLMVQMYVLLCAQTDEGGLRDKPGKPADYYHTCYALSGLSICQDLMGKEEKLYFNNKESGKLKEVHPVYNVEVSKLKKAKEYFASLPKVV